MRVVAATLLLLASTGVGRGHDAPASVRQPLGWQYDYSCCSAVDCSQSQQSEISVTPQGYRVNLTGEVIPYTDTRIKRSKDEFYHRCTPGGKADAKRSLCLYVPDRQG